ncbi:Zn-finger containing protein, partial [Dysosmobacter welbionis]
DLQVDGADAEGREIAVTLYLHATALLRQTQELTLLSDLYSTAYDLTYDAAPLELTSFREQFTRRQTVREVLEIGVVADSILALSVTCGAVSVSREGAGVVLRTGASVRALYLDEGGVPLVAERSIDVSCQLELPEDCRVAARA